MFRAANGSASPLVPLDDRTDKERRTTIARLAFCAEIERLTPLVGKTRAVRHLVNLSRLGELDERLTALLPQALPRMRRPHLSERTLWRWCIELAEGGALDGTNATKTPFDSLATAVADVGLNQDVLIIDELPAKELIKNNASLACAPLYYEGGEEADEPAVDKYAICVTKGEDEILNAINEVIDELGTEGIQSLVNQHLGIEE